MRTIVILGLAACLLMAVGQARAEDLVDGLTYDRLKAILSDTNLQLEERLTSEGNKYLIVQIPGADFNFVATTERCRAGQQNNGLCDGFAYFIAVSPIADILAFSREAHFMKAYPSSSGKASIVLTETFTRGGVHPLNLLNAIANFATDLEYFFSNKKTSARALPSTRIPTFASIGEAKSYFAEKRASAHRRPAKVDRLEVDERFVDYLVSAKP